MQFFAIYYAKKITQIADIKTAGVRKVYKEGTPL